MPRRTTTLAARAGCLLWGVAAVAVALGLLSRSAVPSLDQVLVAAGCAVLLLTMHRYRYEFRHRGARLIASPDAGFVVLLAVAVEPALAAATGLVVGIAAGRHLPRWRERGFQAATALLAAAVPAMVVHDAFGDEVAGRTVLLAVALAALTRAAAVLLAQLLLAESREVGGALTVLRDMPVVTLVALEAGLPTATVAMAGPFLGDPLLALLVVLGGQLLTWRLLALQHAQFTGRRAADRLLDNFQRYVPHHVAQSLAKDGHDGSPGVDVGGDRRELTVLFLDIRGFTSWSERTDPAEVFDELNLLLGELADAIQASEGTIDKFTGDGLMAFWNAPLDQPEHASLAIRSIPRLLMRVREVNLRREARGGVPFEVGIGMASGPAMVGNVGHRNRLAFTAIGDTVNLAARLEAATRDVGVPVLLDERTFLALPHGLQRHLQRLDSIEVKGRRERVRIYTPLALAQRRDSGAA